MQEAMRRGLMPMINAMAAAGVVSLPGMMTGQILAGVPPAEAVRYQLLIMFLIAGATGLGLLMAVLGGAWRLTDTVTGCDRIGWALVMRPPLLGLQQRIDLRRFELCQQLAVLTDQVALVDLSLLAGFGDGDDGVRRH
jgi:hypothetical protein